MISGRIKMDKKSDCQLLIMQAKIEANRKEYDKKTKNLTEHLTAMIKPIMYQTNNSKSSKDNKDSLKYQYTTTVALANNRSPQLEYGRSTKICVM